MCAFNMETTATSQYVKLMESIASIVDIANFKITAKAFSMKAMDPSHVAMIFLKLPAAWFQEYNCEKSDVVRVNMTDLHRTLKRFSPSDTLKISKDVKNNKYRVQFVGKGTRTFRVGILMDEDPEEEPPSPKLDFPGFYSLYPADFTQALKDAQIMGDYVEFHSEESGLVISAAGESGDVTSEITEFVDGSKLTAGHHSMFNLEYLLDIAKVASVATRIDLAFATEMPVQISVPLDHEAKLVYLLAPRVEEEEDVDDISAEEPEPKAEAEEEVTPEPEEEEDMI